MNQSQPDLRGGAQDFGVQGVGHDVAGGVSHPDQDVGRQVLSQVDGGGILAPGLLVRAARGLRRAVGRQRGFGRPT